MREIQTQIEIEAPAERVWQLLTDFAGFPRWNPFILQASGEARAGARLKVRIQPPGSQGMTFRPKVLRAEPNRELRGRGRLWIPGLFDGEHSFLLEPLGPARTRLSQRESFTGLLVPLFGKKLFEKTRQGFEEMNRALKARAENVAEGKQLGGRVGAQAVPAVAQPPLAGVAPAAGQTGLPLQGRRGRRP